VINACSDTAWCRSSAEEEQPKKKNSKCAYSVVVVRTQEIKKGPCKAEDCHHVKMDGGGDGAVELNKQSGSN